MPKISPKICLIRRKKFTSIICKIVRYYRDAHGHPTHEVIYPFGSLRSNEVGIPHVREMFWNTVDRVLLLLQMTRGLSKIDARRIRERFAQVIPVPLVLPTPPVAKPIDPTSKADLLTKYSILASCK